MIFLRHGQSEFNAAFTATRKDPGIVDPKLTELGHRQAREAVAVARAAGVTRIIASPYWRALETAAPIAAALGVPVSVNPIVAERYAFVCDVGSPRSALAAHFPQHDFSAIAEVWWPAIEEPHDSIVGRAARFRAEMAALPSWRDTLVVSHWGFILAMTGQSVANGAWLRVDPNDAPPAELVWRHH